MDDWRKAVLKPFRKEMMKDKHLASVFDYEDSGFCFNGQHIDGVLCISFGIRNFCELIYFYKPTNGNRFLTKRLLTDGNSDIVIRDSRRQAIITKTSKYPSFSQIVSARKPFGISTDIFNNKSVYTEYK
jgi:hypothetical protein